MYHRIRLLKDHLADVRLPGKARLEQLMLRAGETFEAHVRPFIKETPRGPVECANLYLPSGETLLGLRMRCFTFNDEND